MVLYPRINVTTPIDFYKYANVLTDGMFGVGVVYAFFLIVFLSLRASGRSLDTCLVSASFSGVLFSFWFFMMDLIGIQHVLILFAVLVGSVFALKAQEERF